MVSARLRSRPIVWLQPSSAFARALLTFVTLPRMVATSAGVSTDCCVLSTALAGADAGARLTVVTDACAGSTAENHAAALHVMGLYPPQITLKTTAEILG